MPGASWPTAAIYHLNADPATALVLGLYAHATDVTSSLDAPAFAANQRATRLYEIHTARDGIRLLPEATFDAVQDNQPAYQRADSGHRHEAHAGPACEKGRYLPGRHTGEIKAWLSTRASRSLAL